VAIPTRAQQDKGITAFILIFFACIILVLCLRGIESLLSDDAAKHFHVWFQFVCGDWPQFDETLLPRKSWAFALALTVQFLLALAPLGGVLALFWYLANFEKRNFMTLMEALHLRDRMIKTQVLGKIPPDARQKFETDFNDAYNQAARRWAEQQLPNILGPERAKLVIEKMEKEDI
jgi:hypothetical protein